MGQENTVHTQIFNFLLEQKSLIQTETEASYHSIQRHSRQLCFQTNPHMSMMKEGPHAFSHIFNIFSNMKPILIISVKVTLRSFTTHLF